MPWTQSIMSVHSTSQEHQAYLEAEHRVTAEAHALLAPTKPQGLVYLILDRQLTMPSQLHSAAGLSAGDSIGPSLSPTCTHAPL